MHVARLAKHGVLFSLAKSVVLIAPLFAASVLDEAHYGQLEFWISLAAVLGVAISLGAGTVVAYESLKNDGRSLACTAGYYIVILEFACLIISGAVWQASIDISIIVLLSALTASQVVLAARLKGEGLGAWASISESALYICIFISVLLALYGEIYQDWFRSLIVVFILIVNTLLIIRLKLFSQFNWRYRDYSGFVRVGIRFMVAGLVTILFLNIPRILLGYMEGPAATAQFALSFRWVALAIVFHQFSITYFFKEFFGNPDVRGLDGRISLVVGLVFLIAMAIALILNSGLLVPLGLPQPALSEIGSSYLLASAVGLWSMSAFLEGVLYRHGFSRIQIFSTMLGLFFFMVVFFLMAKNFDAVKSAIVAWICGFFITLLFQWFFLRKNGYDFPRVGLMGAAGVLIGVGKYFYEIIG